MDYSQILPRLFVGPCPKDRDDIDRLNNETGVTAVVNLQTDGDFSYWGIDWPVLEALYRETEVEVRRAQFRTSILMLFGRAYASAWMLWMRL